MCAGRLSVLFAMAENGVIGRDGGLPWDCPEDRAFFLATIRGRAVILGRRTWAERGAPLPDCTNVIVSRTLPPPAPGVFVAPSLDAALAVAWTFDPEPLVIGGARLIEEAIPRAARVYLTEIPGAAEGDVFVRFDRAPFRVVSERGAPPGPRFLVLERRAATSVPERPRERSASGPSLDGDSGRNEGPAGAVNPPDTPGRSSSLLCNERRAAR